MFQKNDVVCYRDGLNYTGKIVAVRPTEKGDDEYDIECFRRSGTNRLPYLARGMRVVWRTMEEYNALRSRGKIKLQGE
jgi:hypothetical protein